MSRNSSQLQVQIQNLKGSVRSSYLVHCLNTHNTLGLLKLNNTIFRYTLSVHAKEKYATGPKDQLVKKAASQQQKLPVHTLD